MPTRKQNESCKINTLSYPNRQTTLRMSVLSSYGTHIYSSEPSSSSSSSCSSSDEASFLGGAASLRPRPRPLDSAVALCQNK